MDLNSWFVHEFQYAAAEDFEWNLRTTSAVVLVALCALLANSAGVGGGPFYMPLFHSVLRFNLVKSTALSHTVVTFSAIASTLYGLWASSPEDPSMPLVDLRLALSLLPALLFGVGIGVLLSPILPHWLQLCGLLVLLVFVVRKTYARAQRAWQKEDETQRRLPPLDVSGASVLPVALLGHENEGREIEMNAELHVSCEGANFLEVVECELVQFINWHWKWVQHYATHTSENLSDHIHHVARPFMFALVLWAVFMALQWGLSQSTRCSDHFFALWGLQLLTCVAAAISTIAGQVAVRAPSRTRRYTSPNVVRVFSGSSPILRFLLVSAVMASAGAMAGMVGIGGALIFSPYLLSLGLQPQILASTSVFMILFSSSAIFLSLYFHGFLNTSYAVVFAPVAFVASLVGVFIVGRIVRRTGHPSIIIYILAVLIASGGLLTAVVEGPKAIQNLRHGKDITVHPFCP